MQALGAYQSYRLYLRARLEFGKTTEPPLTLSRLAKEMDSSVSALQMILAGKRNLTVHKIHQITKTLQLTESESEYFEALVLREQSETEFEKRFYQRRLDRWICAPGDSVDLNILRLSSREFLAEWYMPALLVHLLDSPEPNFAKIKKSLGISISQAQTVIKTLTDAGILELRREDKKLHIVYDKMAASFRKEEFMKKLVAEISTRIPTDFKQGTAYYEAHTLTTSTEQYENFVREYKQLLSGYIERGSGTATPVIYQSFIAMMPVL